MAETPLWLTLVTGAVAVWGAGLGTVSIVWQKRLWAGEVAGNYRVAIAVRSANRQRRSSQ
jgi:hypothetical protein